MLLFSACIYKEDVPFTLVDGSAPETSIVIDPPCSFSNYMEIDGLSPNFKGSIINIDEDLSSDYSITADVKPTGTSGQLNMLFTKRRPKKNIIYTYSGNGIVPPDEITWYFKVGSTKYYPQSGKLYVEVLANMNVKFTWCDVAFKPPSSSLSRLSRGSFVLD